MLRIVYKMPLHGCLPCNSKRNKIGIKYIQANFLVVCLPSEGYCMKNSFPPPSYDSSHISFIVNLTNGMYHQAINIIHFPNLCKQSIELSANRSTSKADGTTDIYVCNHCCNQTTIFYICILAFSAFFFSEQHHFECMQPFTKIVFQTFNQKVEIACRGTVSSDFYAWTTQKCSKHSFKWID